jgi:hypothetical protein
MHGAIRNQRDTLLYVSYMYVPHSPIAEVR